jgi:hypothetical protein
MPNPIDSHSYFQTFVTSFTMPHHLLLHLLLEWEVRLHLLPPPPSWPIRWWWEKRAPPLYQYWKAPTVTNKDITAYHNTRWLPGVLVCTPTTLDFATINQTNIVCFELHLMYGLGLPQANFLFLSWTTMVARWFTCIQMPSWRLAVSICCVSVVLAFHLTPTCSGTSILRLVMSTKCSPALGWHYIKTTGGVPKCHLQRLLKRLLPKVVSCQFGRCAPMAEQAPPFAADPG